MFGNDLASLSELLNEENDPRSSRPGVSGPPKSSVVVRQQPKESITAPSSFINEVIWEEADLARPKESINESRMKPRYELLHRQKVRAEDVFLNLGDSDSSSDRCEELSLRIHLPGASLADISLDVLTDRVICQNKDFYLSLALPSPVLKDEGSAKWDKAREDLSIVLPIARDVKYVSNPQQAYC